MKTRKASSFTGLFTVALAFILCNGAEAGSKYVKELGIKQIRAYQDGTFGGCAVTLDRDIQDAVNGSTLTCTSRVISFACDGSRDNSKSAGRGMYDVAMLAWLSEKKVEITLTDDNMIGSTSCWGKSITLTPGIIPPTP